MFGLQPSTRDYPALKAKIENEPWKICAQQRATSPPTFRTETTPTNLLRDARSPSQWQFPAEFSGYNLLCTLSPAPPLTIDSVFVAVKGVKDWRDFGEELGLSPWKLDAIQHEHGSDNLCLKVVVEKLLRGESRFHPSWRAVIWILDEISENHLANKIMDYGEPIQGDWSYSSYNVCVGHSLEALKYWSPHVIINFVIRPLQINH